MDTLDTTDPVVDPISGGATTDMERTTTNMYDRTPYTGAPATGYTTVEETRSTMTTPEPDDGPFSLAAGFLGWCVAAFLTLSLMGILLGIIGTAAYHNSVVVGNTVLISQAALTNLTVAGTIGSLFAIFIAYFVGGYNAGRIDRWHGIGQGAMVVGWTVAFAIVAGVAARAASNAASNTNVAVYFAPYSIDWGALTTGSVVTIVIALVVMLAGACLGGLAGERWLRREIDYTARTRTGTTRGRRV